jgi:phenylpyruvate tautomerase PptA (4-oxalocrotonate tautomerase family)
VGRVPNSRVPNRRKAIVPMIELTTTTSALEDAAKQSLAGELSTIALELEAAPYADFGDVDHMQALAFCFVNEQDVFVGGRRHTKPIYRVVATFPEGAPGLWGPLCERNRQKLVERVTAAVLAAEGTPHHITEAHRVWVHLRFVPDGQWAGFGEVVRMQDIASYSLGKGEPGSKVDRWRQAALESVGAQEHVDA